MSTTIGTVFVNLQTLLLADPDLADVQVELGPPDAYEEQEIIGIFGLADSGEADAVIGGPAPREETYTLQVGVHVEQPAGTKSEVFLRCIALMDRVRAVVYANRRLDEALPWAGWASVTGTTTDGVFPLESGGYVMSGTVRVTCRARIN